MRFRSLLAIGAAAVFVLVGCSQGSLAGGPAKAPVPKAVDTAALKNVTLRLGDQKGSSTQALLQAAGLLDKVPYKVQWSTFTSGPPMLEAIDAGAVDAGQVGNTPPIFSAAANGGINIVGAERSTVGDTLLVPKDSTISKLADLRGKTIAVAKGSSAHGTLLKTLAKAGLTPDDVNIAYLQPADAFAAFSQGNVAAWSAWDPYVTQAVQQLRARELISGADALRGKGLAAGSELSNGYTFQVANRGSLSDPAKNTAIQDYVGRIAKAHLWAKAHPDEWAKLYAQQTGVSEQIARTAVPRLALQPIEIGDALVTSEQKLADAFTAAKQIPSKVDVNNLIDRRYNEAVRPIAAG
jgi:sulfonate transport system substrate-binding protein